MEHNHIIAFILTLIAGLATVAGGSVSFFVKRNNLKMLATGLGFSAGTKPFHFYAMPVLGYRYDYKDNAFAAARLGFILDFERLGFELDFSKYFDKVNNRGYDLELSNTAKFKLFKHSFFYIKHKFYSNESTKIYPQKELNLITLGFELSLLDI